MTPTGAGLKDGSDWVNAFDEPAFEVFVEGGGIAAGDIIFIMDGSYILDSDVVFSVPGTSISPIALIGVKAGTTNVGAAIVYSDWSRDSADRPFIDCATFQLSTGAFTIARNIFMQGSDTYVLAMSDDCLIENCKLDQDVGDPAGKYCTILNTGSRCINNELTSANAHGINSGNDVIYLFNYFHDFPNGTAVLISTAGSACFNIFDTCNIGISSSSKDNMLYLNNTFYACGKGVGESNGWAIACVNNLLEGCTVNGFVWSTPTDSNFFWKNHGDDLRNTDMWSGVDVTTVFQDYEVTAGDPLFTLPGSDFSLQEGSPVEGDGMSVELGV